jgi:hypothetical protein
MDIDLHGYHPSDLGGKIEKLVEQTWEMGEASLRIIHGHGRNRGLSPGFVNTNTGWLGLRTRSVLRHNRELRRYIKYSTLDCSDPGVTEVKLKPNRNPTRSELDANLLGEPRFYR